MRVLLTTQPGLGHLHPMVPLAQALQQAGHEVAFACARSFCPMVQGVGFRSFPAGLDWLESEPEQTFPELQKTPLERLGMWFMSRVLGHITAQQMVPDLLDVCRSWKPDVIVRDQWEFGGCVAAERLDIPHATINVGLFMPASLLRPIIGAQMARLRSAYDLPPDPNLDMLYRYLYLSFVPPSYQVPSHPLAPVAHSLRPVFFDRSGNEELPAWVDQLPARPTVYATLGSVYNRTPGIFQAIIEGLREEPVNLILSVGSNQDPAQFDPGLPHVHVERYIPHTLLFPHCDLIITHGGFNTIMSALSQSLPMLVCPISADHAYSAVRCVALGLGRSIRYVNLSPQAVREAIHDILQDPSYRQNAQRLREEMMSLPDLRRAVALLVKLAVEKTPQIAAGHCESNRTVA
jgi:UDP:flavonoid glycosyltransferase YjiC (YdhE family)